jgi:hypothetical protein
MSGGGRERISVAATTLDDLLETEPAPSFVKIDVEGAEVEVLSGGRGFSRRCGRRYIWRSGKTPATLARPSFAGMAPSGRKARR